MQSTQPTAFAGVRRQWIGRRDELAILQTWMADPTGQTTFVSVSGIGGMGKSALLQEMAGVGQANGLRTLWLDGRASLHTPTGFLEHLRAEMRIDPAVGIHPHASWDHLCAQVNADHRWMVLIDNFEALAPIEGWLMHSFMPRLPVQGMMMILAKRQPLSIAWRSHPAFGNRIHSIALKPLARAETQEYLHQFYVDHDELVIELCQATQGYPLAVSVAADILKQRRVLTEQNRIKAAMDMRALLPDQLARVISGHLFREPIPTHLHEAIDVLTVLGTANQELLNQIMKTGITRTEYHQLADVSFIQNTTQGLALHDIVRTHLKRDFQTREPQRYRNLQGKVVEALYEQVRNGSPNARQLAIQVFQIYIDDLSIRTPYADLTVNDEMFHFDSYQPGDLPSLQAMLQFWRTYSVRPDRGPLFSEFLDRLAEQSPHSIRVVRRDDGQAIAMFVMALVSQETSPLLTRYFPEEMAECFFEGEVETPSELANHYFAILTAFDPNNGQFTGPELGGALIRDVMRHTGLETRMSLIATNPHLMDLLERIGLHRRPAKTRVCDTDDYTAAVFTLDLRGDQFTAWLSRMIGLDHTAAQGPQVVQGAEKEPAGSIPLTDDLIREALNKLWDLPKLDTCGLAVHLGVSGRQVQTWLRTLLSSSPSETGSDDAKWKHLLSTVYLRHEGDVHAAAKDLYMSRATLYRRIGSAIEDLRCFLQYNGDRP